MGRSKKKTISRKKKTVKKQKGGSKLQDITIGILSWNSCTTLRNTLESYKKNGLLSLVKSFIYFQEISDIEKQFANKYSVPYIGTEKNIGIQKAFIEMVNNTKTSYFIFAENDFELVHDMNETQRVLDDCIKLLDNDDVAIVKLRDKENPGEPLYSKGNYENDYKDKPTLQTFPYKLEALSFIESPETVFPNVYTIINYNYKWYKTSNTNNHWSNNIFIAKTSWLKENVLPLIDLQENNTANLYTFENNMIQNLKNYNIAAGIGLFKHNRLDRDDCTVNSIKLLEKYGGNYKKRGIDNTRKRNKKRGGANLPEPIAKIDGSKYCIVQYDNRELSENHKKFMEINKEYCKKHNYSYKFFNYKDENLPVFWLKVKIVKELLYTDEYEGILWLDTDAVIKNTDKTLDSFGDTNTAFIMSNDQYPMQYDDLNKYPFNAGCWIVKNNSNGKLILSDWLNTYNQNSWKKNDRGNLRTNTNYGGDEYEQGMFVNKILPKYKDNILILPWYIFHAFDVSQNKDIFILHFCSNKTIEEDVYLKSISQSGGDNTTAYVINLDERTDRWDKIQETFKNLPFNLERISAIKNENGPIGCALSWVKAVEKAKENNLPYVLIIEDDCKPVDKFDSLWPTVKDWLEKNMDKWEIFTGGNTMYAFTNDTSTIQPLCKIDDNIKLYNTIMSTTHFICINSSAYDKFIDVKQYLTKEQFQVELHDSDRWPNTQKMKIITPVPFIAVQESSHSNTTGKVENYTSFFDSSEKILSSIENSISCDQNGGDNNNFTFLLYTHTDYDDVLELFLKTYNKYFSSNPLSIGTNNKKLIEDKYLQTYPFIKNIYEYDDTLHYFEKIANLLSNISTKYLIFNHECNVLYKDIDVLRLNNVIQEIDDKNIDLVRFNVTGINSPIFDNTLFHENTGPYYFTVHPTIWNKNSFLNFLTKFPKTNYRESENEAIQNYVKQLKNFYVTTTENIKLINNNENDFHSISKIFPTIHITHRGKYKRDHKEVNEILNEYGIDPSVRV